MKFDDCVLSCYDNKEFVEQYNRLTGHHIGVKSGSPIEMLIDEATGFDGGLNARAEAHDFIAFVRDYIYFPVVLMEERATR